jgi:murein DD-endopeptidase MepM/ murein hydrolase activator NlpD
VTREHRGSGERAKALLELQIHPQDIRKKVRNVFLTRRQVATWGVGAALYLAFLGFAVAVSPMVLSQVVRSREHRHLETERARLEERVEAKIDRLESLREDSQDLRLLIDKVFLLYGLSSRVSEGQGGYPLVGVDEQIEPGEDRLAYARTLEASLRERLAVAGFFLEEIQAFEEARKDRVDTTPSLSPLRRADFVLTSPFGDRRNPFTKAHDFHAGIDMAALEGVEILAPADGVVLYAGRYSLQRSVAWWRYGNLVILDHGEHFLTIFGHCDEIRVRRGQEVSQGEVIATVGSTGMSTSPHLHYEVRRRDEDGAYHPVDPRIYILDHRWSDEERILVRSRSAPAAGDFQPLPPLAGR